MAQIFANAARAVLAAGIASGDTTVTIVSGGSLFPVVASPDFARAVLQDANGIEIVLITAHTANATSFTVTRAQEGTTARSFDAGSVFGVRVTAADMDEAVSVTPAGSQTLTNKTFGDNPTFSAGTANAVAFLNGSKVLTTGSALTFDGTTLVSGTGIRANSFMEIRSNTSTLYWENAANTLYWAQKLTGSDFAWDYFNGSSVSEQMRLTSTGLGIGTSSPNAKLTVGDSSGAVLGIPTTASFYGTSSISSSVGTVGLFSTEASAVGVGPTLTFGGKSGNSFSPYPYAFIQGCKASATANDYSGFLRFWTVPSDGSGPVERLRIAADGNLGLGVTPSAWGGGKALDLPTLSGVAGTGAIGFSASFNAYHDGSNWRYKGTTAARAFVMDSASHIWLTAPSGTAGNPISFTQAMTLDASGNLGVGETAPSSRLHVSSTSNSVDTILRVQQKGNNTAAGLVLAANDNNGAGYNFIQSETTGGTTHWRISGGVATSTMAFSTGGTERARITSGGDLLVGTTSVIAGARLSVNGLISDSVGNVRAIPPSGTRTSSYTLVKADVGDYVQVGSGGSITIPDAVFAEGDVVSVFNNTSGTVTITCSITTAYIGGADADKATMTLAARGVATILFISGTICVVNGNVV